MKRAVLLLGTALAALATGAGAGSAQPGALTGKVWVLTALLGKPPLHGTELTSEFTASGNVSGTAGCNHYGGRFTSSGRSLRLSSLVSTQMACATAIMNQEAAFLKALSSTRSYAVEGTKLTLRSAGGRALLTFGAQAEQLAGTSWSVTAFNNGRQGLESVLPSPKLTAVFGKDGNLTGFAGCNDYGAPYKASPPRLSIGPVASTKKACAAPTGVMDQEARYLAALHTATSYRIEGSTLELRTSSGALAAEFRRR